MGWIDDWKVLKACLTNNKGGKRVDVFGRTYRGTYKKFGHKAMVREKRNGNTWLVK